MLSTTSNGDTQTSRSRVRTHPFTVSDGNSESSHGAYARFLIEKNDEFSEQMPDKRKLDKLNSHWPMVDVYTVMVEKWKSCGDRKYKLTKDDVIAIVSAAG